MPVCGVDVHRTGGYSSGADRQKAVDQARNITFSQTGDVHPAATDHINTMINTQCIDLLIAKPGDREHAPVLAKIIKTITVAPITELAHQFGPLQRNIQGRADVGGGAARGGELRHTPRTHA